MRIGIIYVAYQAEDLVPASLTPWVEVKRAQLGGHDYAICAVSVPFEGFPQDEERDRTRSILGAYAQRGEIDHVVVGDKPHKETDARGAGLRWLMTQGVDVVWQVDADEVYTSEEIARIAAFVEANPFVTWFRLSLRNAVFTPTTYLVEPFTPSRIHRVRAGGYSLHSFCDDNDLLYGGTITRDLKRQDQFPLMTVPRSVAFVRHLSWLNDERSRKKVAYQTARGWECSFRWDEATGLQFNEAYYAKRGLPLPEVIHA